MSREPLVPRPWRLTKAVQGLVEEADVIGPVFVNETGWLLAVDTFR